MTYQMTCDLKVRGVDVLTLHSRASFFPRRRGAWIGPDCFVSRPRIEVIDAPHVLMIATTRSIEG